MRGFAAILVLGAGLILPTAAAAQQAQTLTNRFVITPTGERVPLRMSWYVVPYWQTGNYRFPIRNYTFYLDAQGNEVLHGPHTLAYLNGKARELTTYLHGRKHGPFESLGPTFKLRTRGSYTAGELDGPLTWYFESGVVRRTESYAQGVLDGTYREFHENGRLKEEAQFVLGVKQGPVKGFHPNGEQAFSGTYVKGYLSGPFTEYDTRGRKRAEGTLDLEWIVGAWQCFAPDGTLAQVRQDCQDLFYGYCQCPR